MQNVSAFPKCEVSRSRCWAASKSALGFRSSLKCTGSSQAMYNTLFNARDRRSKPRRPRKRLPNPCGPACQIMYVRSEVMGSLDAALCMRTYSSNNCSGVSACAATAPGDAARRSPSSSCGRNHRKRETGIAASTQKHCTVRQTSDSAPRCPSLRCTLHKQAAYYSYQKRSSG
jgi:hypothetical protein